MTSLTPVSGEQWCGVKHLTDSKPCFEQVPYDAMYFKLQITEPN